jgi:hypothetical protein
MFEVKFLGVPGHAVIAQRRVPGFITDATLLGLATLFGIPLQ